MGPFDEATALIAEMTGVVVPKRSAETTVVEAAVDFEAFYAARTKGEAKPMPREFLVGAIDCKGIPMVKPEGAHKTVRPKKGDKSNKKKMATVAAVFSQAPRMRTPEEGDRQSVRHRGAPAAVLARRRPTSGSGPTYSRAKTPSSPMSGPRRCGATHCTGAPG